MLKSAFSGSSLAKVTPVLLGESSSSSGGEEGFGLSPEHALNANSAVANSKRLTLRGRITRNELRLDHRGDRRSLARKSKARESGSKS